MSTPYGQIQRQILKAVNGIAGTTATAMATNYAVIPATTTQAEDPVYNLAFIQDAMADIQGRLALEIASVVNPLTGIASHPWRPFFFDVTAPLANADFLPSQATSAPIIGAWGAVRILAGGSIYTGTPASLERLRASVQNPDSIYTTTLYEYCIYGQRIYFADSAATGVIECCTYNRSVALTNIVAGTPGMALPDALADAFVAGVVQAIVVEEEYMQQSAFYRQYFQDAIALIRVGATAMPGLMVPMGRAA